MSNSVVIYTTWPTYAEAHAAAHRLIEDRSAACANIFPSMTSVYSWNNKTEEASEVVMLIKTTNTHISRIEAAIHELHPYDTPAFLVLPTAYVAPKYNTWMLEALGAQ
jgi:periplasmic divalent cation tolerance protein